jgi:histidine triad (HIT) family protein
VVYFPKPFEGQELDALLPQWLGIPADSKVEAEELPYFFRHYTTTDIGFVDKETARRFRELQEYLLENLQNVQVYRVGDRKIKAFILGKNRNGRYCGAEDNRD